MFPTDAPGSREAPNDVRHTEKCPINPLTSGKCWHSHRVYFLLPNQTVNFNIETDDTPNTSEAVDNDKCTNP